MSLGSARQLRESYKRIIDATLKQVRDGGLIQDAPGRPRREVADELGCRWRAALEQRLAAMEAAVLAPKASPLLPSLLDDAEQPGEFDNFGSTNAVPTPLKTRQSLRPQTVTFFEPAEIPGPLNTDSLPAVQRCIGGYDESHVEIAGPAPGSPSAAFAAVVGAALSGVPAKAKAAPPPPKRARTSPISRGADEAKPPPSLPPPLVEMPRPVAGKASSLAPPENVMETAPAVATESDDDYAGCFDDAEVIVSQVETPTAIVVSTAEPLVAPKAGQSSQAAHTGKNARREEAHDTSGGDPAVVRAAAAANAPKVDEISSEGSELGSDLDLSEFELPEANDVLFADLGQVRRSQKRWVVDLRHGVLQIGGVECLVSSGVGEFVVDDGFETDQ
eukprot:TRINITY_DN43035_c0_g1_i1.p1 TRINITY_DN43035_c0_g1~~TRINITY_DN43035_c0_g1_i1.p1  ORF type:complete len:389 (+),score=74.98 TRINITY_DN43035_c0_g1_i1:93-1259(+)